MSPDWNSSHVSKLRRGYTSPFSHANLSVAMRLSTLLIARTLRAWASRWEGLSLSSNTWSVSGNWAGKSSCSPSRTTTPAWEYMAIVQWSRTIGLGSIAIASILMILQLEWVRGNGAPIDSSGISMNTMRRSSIVWSVPLSMIYRLTSVSIYLSL